MYYFNDVTLNIGCCGSHLISATTWRVSEECWSGVQIRGYGVRRGLQATFRGGGGLGAIFGGGVRQGVRVKGACSSFRDCWKGLGIRSTPKCLQNSEAVGVWRMPKVSEIRVGKTPRCFQSGKQVVPWHLWWVTRVNLHPPSEVFTDSWQWLWSSELLKIRGSNSLVVDITLS